MGLRFECDGCGAADAATALTTVGLLEPVAYCSACLRAWQQAEAEADAMLAESARALEAALRAHRATVRAAGLRRLPDE